MDTKEILWNYFTSTGEIGSYLLFKGLEQAENENYDNLGEIKINERVSVKRSSGAEKSGLQGI